MIVYFLSRSPTFSKFPEAVEKISELVKSFGYKVINGGDISDSDPAKYHKKVMSKMRQSDLVVAEASDGFLDIGYSLGLASTMNVPVLVLFHEGSKIPELLQGISDSRFSVCEYNERSLEELLETELQALLEERDIRFNFFISPQLADYLDWLSRNERTPRAVFLRNMLERKMQFDEDYKNELSKAREN